MGNLADTVRNIILGDAPEPLKLNQHTPTLENEGFAFTDAAKALTRETLRAFIGQRVRLTFTNGESFAVKLEDIRETPESFRLLVFGGSFDYDKLESIAPAPEGRRFVMRRGA